MKKFSHPSSESTDISDSLPNNKNFVIVMDQVVLILLKM